MQMIAINLKDKIESIYKEIMAQEKSYSGYIDEKLQSIEWDVRVLRNRVDMGLKQLKEKQENE